MACGCFVTAVGAADRSESLMNEILGRDDELYKKRYNQFNRVSLNLVLLLKYNMDVSQN